MHATNLFKTQGDIINDTQQRYTNLYVAASFMFLYSNELDVAITFLPVVVIITFLLLYLVVNLLLVFLVRYPTERPAEKARPVKDGSSYGGMNWCHNIPQRPHRGSL